MLGIYKDLSNEDYHAHRGSVSRSALTEFKKSPYHYWASYVKERELKPFKPEQDATDALVFGNAFHTLVLEPESFNDRYIIEPEAQEKAEKPLLLRDVGRDEFEACKARIALQKAKIESDHSEFIHKSYGKVILTNKQFAHLHEMAFAVSSNEQARETIAGAKYEHSIFWNDPETGILCKVRPDIWHEGFLADLKTAGSADARSFQSSIATFGYHIQAAMMREAIRAVHNKDLENFVFVVCEKSYPYCVVPYILEKSAMDKGLEEFQTLLRGLKECRDTNQWPGYPAQTLGLPGWYN